MEAYRAAAIQMTSTADWADNLRRAEVHIERAVRQGADLVALPENFAFMGEDADKLAQAPQIAHHSERFLQRVAQRFRIRLLGGGFPVPIAGENRASNTAVLVDRDGSERARYCKIHLFDADLPDGRTYRESRTIAPGSAPPPVWASPD